MRSTWRKAGVGLSVGMVLSMLGASGLSAPTVNVHVFDRGDDRADKSTGDWSANNYKGECALGQEAVGLSVATSGTSSHALFCGFGSGVPTGPRTGCHNVNFARGEARGRSATGDWDYGYYKGECAANEYVAGVSQSTAGQVQSILCCAAASATHASCAARAAGVGEARESGATSADWDYGYYKGECGPGRYIAGVSRNTANGRAHSILCCGNAPPPGNAAPALNGVNLVPWDGKALADGARIALRVSSRNSMTFNGYDTGTNSAFGPSWVGITNWGDPRYTNRYDYLDASFPTLSSATIFTVTVVPSTNDPSPPNGCSAGKYQKVILKAPNGTYVTNAITGGWAYTAGAAQADARILILDMSFGTSVAFRDSTSTYSMRASSTSLPGWGTGWYFWDPANVPGDQRANMDPVTHFAGTGTQGFGKSAYATMYVLPP